MSFILSGNRITHESHQNILGNEIFNTPFSFSIEIRLGAGAFATVFLARQNSMQRLVALKISPVASSSNAASSSRNFGRPRLTMSLKRPNDSSM